MKTSYKRYGRSRLDWLLAKETKAGREPQCIDPAQISVLVAAIKYVEEVEAAFNSLASGQPNALIVSVRPTCALDRALTSYCDAGNVYERGHSVPCRSITRFRTPS